MKKIMSDWCTTHKRYHGKKKPECEIVATRDLLGDSFIKWMESRGVRFVDVYPVSMAKKKGKE